MCGCDCDCLCCQEDKVRLGQEVPEFEMDVFEPTKGDFGKISLKELKDAGKWTILFFYPADFTFV